MFRWAWRSSCVQIGRARGGCALIRMHGALRWRNSFHGTRVPDHISPQWAGICVNGTEPGSVISPPQERGPAAELNRPRGPKSRATSPGREVTRELHNKNTRIWKSGIFQCQSCWLLVERVFFFFFFFCYVVSIIIAIYRKNSILDNIGTSVIQRWIEC